MKETEDWSKEVFLCAWRSTWTRTHSCCYWIRTKLNVKNKLNLQRPRFNSFEFIFTLARKNISEELFTFIHHNHLSAKIVEEKAENWIIHEGEGEKKKSRTNENSKFIARKLSCTPNRLLPISFSAFFIVIGRSHVSSDVFKPSTIAQCWKIVWHNERNIMLNEFLGQQRDVDE